MRKTRTFSFAAQSKRQAFIITRIMAIQNSDPVPGINPETGVPDPVGVCVISQPSGGSKNAPGFFLLTSDSDTVEVTNDVIENFPEGIFALEGNDFVRFQQTDNGKQPAVTIVSLNKN